MNKAEYHYKMLKTMMDIDKNVDDICKILDAVSRDIKIFYESVWPMIEWFKKAEQEKDDIYEMILDPEKYLEESTSDEEFEECYNYFHNTLEFYNEDYMYYYGLVEKLIKTIDKIVKINDIINI